MFVPRGDRDLGVAYKTHPGNQASSRGEAKNSAVLLSRNGYLLEPTVCPKGSQASCGVWIEDSGAGQEATIRTRHGTTDWLQIGKGVCQGCILSPCLFHLYAEYILRLFPAPKQVQVLDCSPDRVSPWPWSPLCADLGHTVLLGPSH